MSTTARGNPPRSFVVAAVAGAVIPHAVVLPWFAENGLRWQPFFGLPFSSRPAAMFSIDVHLSAAVFLVWADVECRRLDMGGRWRPLAALLLAGLCFAMPLFLARSEAVISMRGQRRHDPDGRWRI